MHSKPLCYGRNPKYPTSVQVYLGNSVIGNMATDQEQQIYQHLSDGGKATISTTIPHKRTGKSKGRGKVLCTKVQIIKEEDEKKEDEPERKNAK